MEEIWKDIPGWEEIYQASNMGRIKSLGNDKKRKEKILKTRKSRLYEKLYLCRNGKRFGYFVHRLVWEAFNGPIPEGMVINHMDENPANNRLDNIMVCSQKENVNWGTAIERRSAKLSKWVIQLNKNNEILHFYPSIKEAGIQTGINKKNINMCCKGTQLTQTYKNKQYHYTLKTAGGFKWKYAE